MSEPELIEASPCKLRSGDWGCKTSQPVSVGDTVQIVTRANKQWRARITQIVWTDDQTCICATESENGATRSNAPRSQSPGQAASGESASRRGESSASSDEHEPAPPRFGAMPSDDLDAMADAASEQERESDDVMSAMAEFEREGRQ